MEKKLNNLNNKIGILKFNINPNKDNETNFDKGKIQQLKTMTHSQTERGNIFLNEFNDKSDYSKELFEENEEEEFNSDEYISSTMLDVDTNTYIDFFDKKSNISLVNDNEKKSGNKSPSKNYKNYVRAININDNDYLKEKKKNEISNSGNKNNKIDNYSNSVLNSKNNGKNKFKKKIRINNDNIKDKSYKDIIYKQIDVKKTRKKNENKINNFNQNCNINTEKEPKNFSVMGNNSPKINNVLDKENAIKSLNNMNANINNKNKGFKKIHKKIKTEINMVNGNNLIRHVRSPTLIDNNINKNKYLKEFFLKSHNNNINERKFMKINFSSPYNNNINNKFGINSMKVLNSINSINNSEAYSSIINNPINYKPKNFLLAKNNLKSDIRTISTYSKINANPNKEMINKTITLNNINKNFNPNNHIILSPRRQTLDNPPNRNINNSNVKTIMKSNSISIDTHKIKYNKNKQKNSERLLTYDSQEHKLLSRNMTFKNKRYFYPKNKFFKLLLNKKKLHCITIKNLLTINNKSPKLKLKINNLNQKTDSNNNKINKNIKFQKFKNKNKSNYSLMDKNFNLYSNKKNKIQYKTAINTIHQSENKYKNKIKQKNNSKLKVDIKKEKLTMNDNISSNISVPYTNKINNLGINPFIYQENKKYVKIKNLSISKSKTNNEDKSQNYKTEKNNINITSINSLNNKRSKKEISLKKKNKQRAKTLMEEDYIRDIIINSIHQNSNFNNHNNNKCINNYLSLRKLDEKNIYNKKSNYWNSMNDNMIKTPHARSNINFNININMNNNNNYKKLIYHCHGNHRHYKSSVNYGTNNNTNINTEQSQRGYKNNQILNKNNSNLIFQQYNKCSKKYDINSDDENGTHIYNKSEMNPISYNNYNINNNYPELNSNAQTIIHQNRTNKNKKNFKIPNSSNLSNKRQYPEKNETKGNINNIYKNNAYENSPLKFSRNRLDFNQNKKIIKNDKSNDNKMGNYNVQKNDENNKEEMFNLNQYFRKYYKDGYIN